MKSELIILHFVSESLTLNAHTHITFVHEPDINSKPQYIL